MDRRRTITLAVALTASSLLVGCTSYYKVSDPATGRSYYTTKVKNQKGGAVAFEDLHTGAKLTMQNSAVLKVTEEEAMNPAQPEAEGAHEDADGDGDGDG